MNGVVLMPSEVPELRREAGLYIIKGKRQEGLDGT